MCQKSQSYENITKMLKSNRYMKKEYKIYYGLKNTLKFLSINENYLYLKFINKLND